MPEEVVGQQNQQFQGATGVVGLCVGREHYENSPRLIYTVDGSEIWLTTGLL